MSVKTVAARHTTLLAASVALAMLAIGPIASASVVRINFGGAAGHGYADLTIAQDPAANAKYDPSVPATTQTLSPYDPAGASLITGAAGSFEGISINGILGINPGLPPALVSNPSEYENLPASFSWFGGNSYDNLFYAAGSPWVCPPGGPQDYPFHGGFLDIFGVVFSLENGNYVQLWSDGVVPPGFAGTPGGLTFGMNVFEPNASGGGYTVISSQFAGATAAVPAPSGVWLFGAGLLGLLVWRRRRETRLAAARADD